MTNKNLTQIRKGETVIISALALSDDELLSKVITLGLLPGSTVELIQDKPVLVLKLDETMIAIDKQLAKSITVTSTIEGHA